MQLKATPQKKNNGKNVVFFMLLTALVSLAFSIRLINSLSIIALFLFPLIHRDRRQFIKTAFHNLYFISLLALFLLQIAGVLYATDKVAGWEEVTKKAGIVAIPFFFCSFQALSLETMKRLMLAFSISLVIVSMYCLVNACILYAQHHEGSVFFYHTLLLPFGHHAVFFSFFIFYCVLYWTAFVQQRSAWINAMLIFFIGMTFLLSSKLVIVLTIVYFIYVLITSFMASKIKLILLSMLAVLITMIAVIAITDNPVKDRFKDVTNGNPTLFEKNKFSPAVYFNGVQFRLLVWRFTFEILESKKDWLLGVSPGDAQHELNKKYAEANMYLGEGKEDKGFWDYNCHNVFLQTLLESGIIGLGLLLTAVISFITRALKERKFKTLIFFISIVIYGFAESLLSTQYAILLFTFFPLLSFNAEAEQEK